MLGGGHEISNRVVGRHHSADDVVEKTWDAERVNHADTDASGNSKCKWPEVGECLMFGASLAFFLSVSLISFLNSKGVCFVVLPTIGLLCCQF